MTRKTERIGARFPADVKAMAERAALASGYTLTDYLVYLVRSDAPRRLKAEREIQLTNQGFDNFVKACEAAKPPGKKILEAARKLDQEGF